MDSKVIHKNQKQSWTQKQNKTTMKNKKTQMEAFTKKNEPEKNNPNTTRNIHSTESKPQYFYTPNNQLSNYPKTTSFMQKQYIILDEIEEMAPQMMYNHINIALNLTAFYDQADLFTLYF
jgi:hypothetical protein